MATKEEGKLLQWAYDLLFKALPSHMRTPKNRGFSYEIELNIIAKYSFAVKVDL